jgi:short-subunit dehydrogenase involved in D-alanine esterification of teichoic acids
MLTVTSVMKTHPTIDCVYLNAGQQSRYNFSDPSKVDLKKFNDEFHINFTATVALVHAFLPYLLKKDEKTAFFL